MVAGHEGEARRFEAQGTAERAEERGRFAILGRPRGLGDVAGDDDQVNAFAEFMRPTRVVCGLGHGLAQALHVLALEPTVRPEVEI